MPRNGGNMREIKFRLWDKTQEKMHYDNFQITFNGQLAGTFGLFPSASTLILQYTGLKDKNGKEIYEGDIIEGHKATSETWYNFKSSVFFQDGCFTIEVAKDYHPCLYECSNIEIIGNIYENLKFLKENT